MTLLNKHKHVEFTELFYDLVFVYAISKTTGLIHHLQNGMITPLAFITFITGLLVLVNTWMLQTVFTNRYGKNSLLNMIFMFIDMGILMFLSNMFTTQWEQSYQLFVSILAGLSFTLFLQYFIQYTLTNSQNEKNLIIGFFYILGIRTFGVIISLFFPYNIGIWIYFISIIISFIMPIFLGKRMSLVSINFPHLVERISLFVIITFGEMIINVAHFFTPETFKFDSILYFLIVICLFLLYFGEFDHAIDNTRNTLGFRFIYSYQPIFIGILIITVSLTFLNEPNVNHLFVVWFLYIGILLFIIPVHLNGYYNKIAYRWSRSYLIINYTILLIGFILSLIFASSSFIVTSITTGSLCLMWIAFIRFYLKRHKQSNDPHEIYFI